MPAGLVNPTYITKTATCKLLSSLCKGGGANASEGLPSPGFVNPTYIASQLNSLMVEGVKGVKFRRIGKFYLLSKQRDSEQWQLMRASTINVSE